MIFDIDKIQSGKTTRIIKWVKKGRVENKKDSSNRIIVVPTEQVKQKLIKKYNLGYHEIESFRTIQRYFKSTLQNKEIWFDNIERILSSIFPAANIIGISGEKSND